MAFLAYGGNKTPVSISHSAEGALQNVWILIRELLRQAVCSRNEQEFRSTRAEVFPKYAEFLRAYANIVRASLSLGAIKQLNYESLLDLEVHLRATGMEAFGEQIKDQSIFAIWTLRQINELVPKLADKNLTHQKREEDRELIHRFTAAAFYSRFSLDCLLIAMTEHIKVSPGVLSEISESLRGIVNAYAYVKQGYVLRQPEERELVSPIEWDEEDEVMLASSAPITEA